MRSLTWTMATHGPPAPTLGKKSSEIKDPTFASIGTYGARGRVIVAIRGGGVKGDCRKNAGAFGRSSSLQTARRRKHHPERRSLERLRFDLHRSPVALQNHGHE